MTGFDDLLDTDPTATTDLSVPPAIIGTALTAQEVKDRLSIGLYTQLADGSDSNVLRAATRATKYACLILARLGQKLNLDDQTGREICLMYTIYELHMALGHEAAGREYRIRARDLVIARWGSFPESDKADEGRPVVGAITVPKRSGR